MYSIATVRSTHKVTKYNCHYIVYRDEMLITNTDIFISILPSTITKQIVATFIAGADLEILGRGFLTTASGLLISQLSLMITVGFYHPLT